MTISAKADAAIEKTMTLEAGFVDNPNDRGGPTKFGVTQAVARAWGYTGDMRNLPRAVAKQILVSEYWTKPGYDAINDVNGEIAWEMFDAGVLSGQSMPIKWLQQALRVLNTSHKTEPYPDPGVDGSLGKNPASSATLAALKIFLRNRGADGVTVILRMLNAQQGAYFISITNNRVQNEEFIFGWFLHRVTI